MAIKGTSQEVKNNLLTGVSEVRVLAFNPTLADYEAIYGPRENQGEEEPKEPEYLKEKDGKNMLLATFIVEDVLKNRKQKIVFPIMEEVEFKETSGNTLWVNDQGQTTYIDSEENLKEYFITVKKYDSSTKRMEHFRDSKVREGFSGEKAFLDFMSQWLNFDFSLDADTEIWLDMKKMFNGDFREIKGVVEAFKPQTVICAWHVTTKTNDETGEVKQYQNIYRGAFSNSKSRKSNLMATFNNLFGKGVDWAAWVNIEANKKDWSLRNFRRFIEQLLGDYKPDGFILQPLGDYDPTKDLAASAQTKHDDPSYSTNADY